MTDKIIDANVKNDFEVSCSVLEEAVARLTPDEFVRVLNKELVENRELLDKVFELLAGCDSINIVNWMLGLVLNNERLRDSAPKRSVLRAHLHKAIEVLEGMGGLA